MRIFRDIIFETHMMACLRAHDSRHGIAYMDKPTWSPPCYWSWVSKTTWTGPADVSIVAIACSFAAAVEQKEESAASTAIAAAVAVTVASQNWE